MKGVAEGGEMGSLDMKGIEMAKLWLSLQSFDPPALNAQGLQAASSVSARREPQCDKC